MGGCESVPEEEVYEYPRRRRIRRPTEIVYSRPPPRSMIQYPMMYPYERRYPMAPPVIDGPMYGGGYRRFDDGYYDDYDMYDRGRTRYSYHAQTR